MTWKKTQFRRSIHENAIAKGMDPMIAAYVSDKAPGLAIHRHSADSKSGWKVSHIPTGKATGFDALNLTAAKALAEHMATWFDWSQDNAGYHGVVREGRPAVHARGAASVWICRRCRTRAGQCSRQLPPSPAISRQRRTADVRRHHTNRQPA